MDDVEAEKWGGALLAHQGHQDKSSVAIGHQHQSSGVEDRRGASGEGDSAWTSRVRGR